MSQPFIDTNVLLYAFGSDQRSAAAGEVLAAGGIVAVQSLNEFVNVARRKFRLTWAETREALAQIRMLCTVRQVVTLQTHEQALYLAERYGLNVHDAMLLAIALEAGCDTFISEDLQDGLRVEGRLTVRNPFA